MASKNTVLFNIKLDKDFSFKVNSHIINVKFADLEDNGDYGYWSAPKLTIYIHKHCPYSVKFSTFLHEFIHVLETFYGIKVTHKDLNLIGDFIAHLLLENFIEVEENVK